MSVSFTKPGFKLAISNKRMLKAILIWGLATAFYFYDNLLQVSPSAMRPELSLAFAKQAETFGSLSAYCLYAYGLMQIPAGLLMDRFGPRAILTLASACCGLGSFLFGVANTLWEAKLARVMIGVGASFAFVGCLKIIRHWFSVQRFAFITGLTVTVGFLGAVFGVSTVSTLVEQMGWRQSMYWGGILGLLLSAALWLLTKDKTTSMRTSAGLQDRFTVSPTAFSIWQGLWQVLRHRQTWIAALYAGFMFVPTLAFGGLWGVPFLVEAHGFDRVTAGICISFIYIGWMFGCPLWGFISDFFKRRNVPMLIATLLALVDCIAVIYLHALPWWALNSLLFLLGFFSSGFVLAFAVVQESNSLPTAGTAIGFTNALNTLWGAIAQPFIGFLLDQNQALLFGNNGEAIFTLKQYQQALLVLPISLLMALFLLRLLKETFCQPNH